MGPSWRAIFDCCRVTLPLPLARRAANFCLSAYAVHKAELPVEGGCLAARVAALSTALGDPISLPAGLADRIAGVLAQSPRLPLTQSALDSWVEAFQAADSHRKSLGAYATPAPFADALAHQAFDGFCASKALRIVDPAAGAGSLLLAAFRTLIEAGIPPAEAVLRLHGVELDPASRELCVLKLWLAAGGAPDLVRIAGNSACDNAITRDWRADYETFDILLMNPPWESLRHGSSDAAHSRERVDTVRRLGEARPGAAGLPPLFTAQGRGDRNLFKAFVELAPHLLRPGGRLGALIPAAFGSDDGMTGLRRLYLDHFALESWTSFENRAKLFDIDSRYKFGLLTGTRSTAGTGSLNILSFAVQPDDINKPHVRLSRTEITRIGGSDCMIPELTFDHEREILVQMLQAGKPFFSSGPFGQVLYRREVDLTLGRRLGHFRHVSEAQGPSSTTDSPWVPVIEGRMVGQFDCFQKSWVSGSGRTAQWEYNGSKPVSKCVPQYVGRRSASKLTRIALCDVTSATNTRTVIATLVPPGWICGNTAPVLVFNRKDHAYGALAVLNSIVFDWLARRIVGGVHLNKFYLARLTWPHLSPGAIGRLAALGKAVAASHPRGGLADGERSAPLGEDDLILARAMIELEIASAYRLAQVSLEKMLANDPADRRGMWRYFQTDPHGLRISRLVLELAAGDGGLRPALREGMLPSPRDRTLCAPI
jgi:predicted RNA methylase